MDKLRHLDELTATYVYSVLICRLRGLQDARGAAISSSYTYILPLLLASGSGVRRSAPKPRSTHVVASPLMYVVGSRWYYLYTNAASHGFLHLPYVHTDRKEKVGEFG